MSASTFLMFSAGLVLLTQSTSAGTVTDPRRLGYSIYDEGICTSKIDCKPSQICAESRQFGGVCRDNVPEGPLCGLKRCLSTEFCDTSSSTCKLFGAAGSVCDIFRENCRKGLVCKNGQCIQFPNLPDGATCGKGMFDNECRGYCKKDVPDPFVAGLCVSALQIVKKLGEPCNRTIDGCDVTRNLLCRRVPKQHKDVCLQKRIDEESPCERGNPLSRCAPGLECRVWRQGVNPDDKFSAELVLPTLCLPRVRHRAPGQPCLQERDRCTGQSTCRNVPGVARDTGSSRIARSFTSPALYCTRTLKRFTQCSPQEKFLAQCDEGFSCRGGKCQKSRRDNTVTFTHAYDNAICERLPCGPGFKCIEPEVKKRDFNGPAPSKRCRET